MDPGLLVEKVPALCDKRDIALVGEGVGRENQVEHQIRIRGKFVRGNAVLGANPPDFSSEISISTFPFQPELQAVWRDPGDRSARTVGQFGPNPIERDVKGARVMLRLVEPITPQDLSPPRSRHPSERIPASEAPHWLGS